MAQDGSLLGLTEDLLRAPRRASAHSAHSTRDALADLWLDLDGAMADGVAQQNQQLHMQQQPQQQQQQRHHAGRARRDYLPPAARVRQQQVQQELRRQQQQYPQALPTPYPAPAPEPRMDAARYQLSPFAEAAAYHPSAHQQYHSHHQHQHHAAATTYAPLHAMCSLPGAASAAQPRHAPLEKLNPAQAQERLLSHRSAGDDAPPALHFFPPSQIAAYPPISAHALPYAPGIPSASLAQVPAPAIAQAGAAAAAASSPHAPPAKRSASTEVAAFHREHSPRAAARPPSALSSSRNHSAPPGSPDNVGSSSSCSSTSSPYPDVKQEPGIAKRTSKATELSSSLNVFLNFCVFEDAAEAKSAASPTDELLAEPRSPNCLDASGIFTRECFEAWLTTRAKALKKPEESYRKTITAHTQGTDGRKPFPPNVEKAVLVELRKQKVWPCFQNRMHPNGEAINIGLQGFRGLGFHENHSYEVTGANMPGIVQQSQSPDSKSTKRKRRLRGSVQARQQVIGGTCVQTNLREWRKAPTLIKVTADRLQVTPKELFPDPSRASDIFENDDPAMLLQVLSNEVRPRTIRAAVLVVMTRFFMPHQFLSLMSVTNVFLGENFIFDQRILSLDLSFRDPRFEHSFLLAHKELLPDRPIAHNVFCLNTSMFISADKTSLETLEGNVTGALPQHLVHPLIFWMILLQVFPRLFQSEDHTLVWQAYTKTLRGRNIITRTQYRIVGSTIHTAFQDVTDLYPHLMELPPIDEVIDRFLAAGNGGTQT